MIYNFANISIVKKRPTFGAPLPNNIMSYYDRVCVSIYGVVQPRPARLFRIPFLGVEPAVLPEEAIPLLVQPSVAVSSAHDRVVAALAQACAPLDYAPQLPTLCLILLQQLRWGEARTFCTVLDLTRRSQSALANLLASPPPVSEGIGSSSGRGGGLNSSSLLADVPGVVPPLVLSRDAEVAFVRAFRTILKGVSASLSSHLEALPAQRVMRDGQEQKMIADMVSTRSTKNLLSDTFSGLFSGFLPPRDVGRIIKAFLEPEGGPALLLRAALALVLATSGALLAARDVAEADRALRAFVAHGLRVENGEAAAEPLKGCSYIYSWEAFSRSLQNDVPPLPAGLLCRLLTKYLHRATGGTSSLGSVVGANGVGGSGSSGGGDVALDGAADVGRPLRSRWGEFNSSHTRSWHNPKVVVNAPSSVAAAAIHAVTSASAARTPEIGSDYGGDDADDDEDVDEDEDGDGGLVGGRRRSTGSRYPAPTLSSIAPELAAKLRRCVYTRLMNAEFRSLRETWAGGAGSPRYHPEDLKGGGETKLALWPVVALPSTGALLPLLPQAACHRDWRCVFSSDWWETDSQARTMGGGAGVVSALLAAAANAPRGAPLLIFFFISLGGAKDTAPEDSGSARLGTATSRPVFGIASADGLPQPAKAGGSRQTWVPVVPGDILFQLYPDLKLFNSSASPNTPVAGRDDHIAVAATRPQSFELDESRFLASSCGSSSLPHAAGPAALAVCGAASGGAHFSVWDSGIVNKGTDGGVAAQGAISVAFAKELGLPLPPAAASPQENNKRCGPSWLGGSASGGAGSTPHQVSASPARGIFSVFSSTPAVATASLPPIDTHTAAATAAAIAAAAEPFSSSIAINLLAVECYALEAPEPVPV
jgi:hypothetical protein